MYGVLRTPYSSSLQIFMVGNPAGHLSPQHASLSHLSLSLPAVNFSTLLCSKFFPHHKPWLWFPRISVPVTTDIYRILSIGVSAESTDKETKKQKKEKKEGKRENLPLCRDRVRLGRLGHLRSPTAYPVWTVEVLQLLRGLTPRF